MRATGWDWFRIYREACVAEEKKVGQARAGELDAGFAGWEV